MRVYFDGRTCVITTDTSRVVVIETSDLPDTAATITVDGVLMGGVTR